MRGSPAGNVQMSFLSFCQSAGSKTTTSRPAAAPSKPSTDLLGGWDEWDQENTAASQGQCSNDPVWNLYQLHL